MLLKWEKLKLLKYRAWIIILRHILTWLKSKKIIKYQVNLEDQSD